MFPKFPYFIQPIFFYLFIIHSRPPTHFFIDNVTLGCHFSYRTGKIDRDFAHQLTVICTTLRWSSQQITLKRETVEQSWGTLIWISESGTSTSSVCGTPAVGTDSNVNCLGHSGAILARTCSDSTSDRQSITAVISRHIGRTLCRVSLPWRLLLKFCQWFPNFALQYLISMWSPPIFTLELCIVDFFSNFCALWACHSNRKHFSTDSLSWKTTIYRIVERVLISDLSSVNQFFLSISNASVLSTWCISLILFSCILPHWSSFPRGFIQKLFFDGPFYLHVAHRFSFLLRIKRFFTGICPIL